MFASVSSPSLKARFGNLLTFSLLKFCKSFRLFRNLRTSASSILQNQHVRQNKLKRNLTQKFPKLFMSFNLHLNDIQEAKGSAEAAAEASSEQKKLLEQYVLSCKRQSSDVENDPFNCGRDKCASLSFDPTCIRLQAFDSFLSKHRQPNHQYFLEDQHSHCHTPEPPQTSKAHRRQPSLKAAGHDGDLTVYSRQLTAALRAGKSVWL